MNLRPALVVMLLATATQLATAQAVWRCGADGRQFSDKPCEQGRALDTLEPRPASDLAAAKDSVQRDKALAAQLVKERQLREAQAPKAAAGIRMAKAEEPVKPKTTPKPPKRSAKHHPAEDGIWRATAPSFRQTKG